MAFGRGFQNNFRIVKIRFSFPLGVALVALVVYVLTLSGGVALNSLLFTTKVAGWDWQPMSSRPFAWLITLPVRWLPGSWIPGALNLFSALTAAATLGILARSVSLLRWDCPPDAQQKWALHLPALLACGLCGLEFNFWQDATAMTGEMLGVLLLAAGMGCALEFRAEKNPRWLDAAAVVWGVGLAENWAMQLMLPFFLVALAWLPGWKKIGRPFFIRLVLIAVAALIIFSLPPLANGLARHSPWSLKEAWLASLQSAKGGFRTLYLGFWSWHRLLTVVLLLYFLLPVLACVVRIKNEGAVFGVERMQVRIFRALRAGLLLVCLWLAFDPEIGPRKIILKQFGLPLPLLTFDYLLGLGTAFLAGSLLYAAQSRQRKRSPRRLGKIIEFVRRSAGPLLTAVFIFAAAALAAHSWPGIAQARRTPLTIAGELVVRSLPADGGIILGDDAAFLMVVQAALAQHRLEDKWQTVEMPPLPGARYRAALEAKFPWGWSTNGVGDLTPGATRDELLDRIASHHRIFYLLPEPGHFLFESFYPQPQGAAQELKNYTEKTFAVPALTAQQIADNEKFWDAAWAENLAVAGQITSRQMLAKPGWLMLLPVSPDTARQVGRWYSIALNNWGVKLQRNGRLAEARHRFEQALVLNPDNPSVPVNLVCNSNLLAGKNLDLSGAASLVRSISSVRQLARIIDGYGIVDEPSVCLVLGEACFNAGWPRQALQQLDRARTLAPDSVAPGLTMAKIFSRIGADSRVIEMAGQLRLLETNSPAGRALGLELSILEAKTWLAHTNLPQANRVLETVLHDNPDDPVVWETVFQVYLSRAYLFSGSATNALRLLDRMLTKEPDNLAALNNKAAVLLQLQRAPEAIPILNRALALTNLPAIKLNRALALLQAQDLPAAAAAYQELQTAAVDQFTVHYGLSQIAEQRHDTNAAIHHLEFCLTNAPAGGAKWQEVSARLAALGKTKAN